MVERIKITLVQEEIAILLEISRQDLRTPDEEIRFLLREEAKRRAITGSSNDEPFRPSSRVQPRA
jgi:hypothetical protein